MNKDKEEVIHMMCLEYRHDYELRKQPDDPPLQPGMTERDAKVLYNVMEFIYNELIKLAETKSKGKLNATKRRKRKS